jgi:hypothetical protein
MHVHAEFGEHPVFPPSAPNLGCDVSCVPTKVCGVPAQAEITSMQRKIEFFHSARQRPAPIADVPLDAAVAENLLWLAGRSHDDVIASRERIIGSIEQLAMELSSQSEAWFDAACADQSTRRVSCGVNGPLLAYLAKITGYEDAACVDVFRNGAQMSGAMRQTCNGTPHEHSAPTSVEALEASIGERNALLASSLSADKHAIALLEQMHAEAEQGWLSHPVRLSSTEAQREAETSCARRFGVEQIRSDGTAKIRAVDDFSESGLNPTVLAMIKLANDSVKALELAIKSLRKSGVADIRLWKADVKSAYRRMPVRPSDRRFLGVLLRVGEDIWMSKHLAAPFGAVGSVYEWDRLGHFFCHLARHLLKLPVFRYVDDFFAAEPTATADHAMATFERLLACLLGPGTLAKDKLQAGMPLDILGVSVDLIGDEVRVQLADDKRARWRQELMEVLQRNQLNPARALKIAGKLSFAALYSFLGIGRTMLWPLFRQHYHPRRSHSLGDELRDALSWWVEALSTGFPRTIPLGPQMPVVEMLCDARSSPPRLSAVVSTDEQRFFTDWAPDDLTLSQFQHRGDGQITSLELLAVALGLATFSDLFKGKLVRVWVDNTGCEHMTRRQSGRSRDHNDVVRAIWMNALHYGHGLWIERVSTHEHIADDPSREDYKSMEVINATWRRPCLKPSLLRPALRHSRC